MDVQLYWLSALTYAVVIGMILFSDVKVDKITGKFGRSFRIMASWVLFFCIQDAVWGLCDAQVIKSDIVFFVSSCIFHISTVITTFFWLKYVLEYLGDKVKNKKLYLLIDGIVIGVQFILVVINIFKTTIFSIVDGEYVTGTLRPVLFANQYIVYFVIGITALVFVLKKKSGDKTKYKTVFFFTLAPILLGVFQLLFPNAPFYSLGYFLGFFIVHIFIVTKDREDFLEQETQFKKILELNDELNEKQVEIDGQYEVLKSMSRVYDYINMLDFKECAAIRFDKKDSIKNPFNLETDPHTALNKNLVNEIVEGDREKFWEYTNLSTLEERMKGERLLSAEFECKNEKWICALYIRIGQDRNAPLNQVAYCVRNITSDRKREHQVYNAMANLVYSLHVFDLENDTMDRLIESDVFKKIVGNETSPRKMADTIIRATCKDEFLDLMLKFADLSTVSERMQGKNSLQQEFVGKYHGWTRMIFIPIERKNGYVKKMVVITEIIDAEKNEMINLIYKSNTDELTRLYNRRNYEDDLDELSKKENLDDCVVVALDVNGLKTANDTMGHKAGDELIIGASSCMNKCFVSVGKSYRTGGDEFMAILHCSENEAKNILADFDAAVNEWKGNLVEKLSVSYGYVAAKEFPNLKIRELAAEADKRMYENKSAYYVRNRIERRKSD